MKHDITTGCVTATLLTACGPPVHKFAPSKEPQ
jgi:hypothetical protein